MSYMGSTTRRAPPARPAALPVAAPPVAAPPAPLEPELGFFQALCDREAVSYFVGNVWSAAIFSWTFYFLAAASAGAGLPFSSLTNFTLFLAFVTRTGFVPCPNLTATTGIFGGFTVLTFWIVVAAQGRVAAFGDTSYMLFKDLTSHLAIPLDAFVRPLVFGYYRTFLGLWYTAFFAFAYLGYVLVLPEPPYPFLLTWTPAELYGFYGGALVAILLAHGLVVGVVRQLGKRAAA